MSKCTDITRLETIPAGDVMRVVIDDSTEALWIYNYAEAMKFVGQEVIVEYRQDIYKGQMRQFIATFVIPTVVSTLDKTENIKLYCDQTDNFSNLSFNEIGIGETRQNCIVFCVSCEFKSSSAAAWQELIIRDRSMRTAKLRLFSYDNKAADFTGKYVMTELSRSQYGFKSDCIVPVQGECPPNPEIAVAKQFIQNYFKDDSDALAYMAKYNLISFMEESVDYEKGYGLVRLAMELSIVDNMQNVTKDVDLQSIGEALLASRGYYVHESVLSKTVNNIILASSINWKNKSLVLQLLDFKSDDNPEEYSVMESIRSMVGTLLKVRKGLLD